MKLKKRSIEMYGDTEKSGVPGYTMKWRKPWYAGTDPSAGWHGIQI